jgi:hypothetical protein
MVVKLPKMTEKEIQEVIKKNNICRIAFIDDEFPYISPFQYLYENDTLYFHLTDYGKKVEILKKNNNVCVAIEEFDEDLSQFQFISIQGKLKELKDLEEKKVIAKKMVKQASTQYSKQFLKAHGFKKEDDWDKFSSDTSVRIFKLKERGKRVALKSG